jgi:hypothetical protein
MRKMNCASIQARLNAPQDGPLSEEGSAALTELRVMLSRTARHQQAYTTADAGRLARQNWHVHRA